MTPRFALVASVLSLAALAHSIDRIPQPLTFEENLGQASPSTRMLARSPQVNIFFLDEGFSLALAHNNEPIVISFVGSHAESISGEDQLQGVSNYLVGSDPKRWHTGVRHFQKVRYRNLYPGADAIFYSSGDTLEFDLLLEPGADSDPVLLRVDGIRKLSVHGGDLVLQLPHGQLRCKQPHTYQLISGVKQPVEATYKVHGNQVRIVLGRHDKDVATVVDPSFDYATYLGGSGAEWAYSAATDNSGDIYVTGVTQSANFPSATGLQRSFGGGLGDIFVTKIAPDSGGIQYSTYIGGSAAEGDTSGYVGGIAVDAAGNAFITGVTRSSDFPTTPASFQPVFGTRDTCGSGPAGGPCGDAFVLKLSPTGTALVYSSFLGGRNHDEGKALALDSGGNIYVTGITTSTDFPTTGNAFQRVLQYQDAFVSKISPDGSKLLYSTLLGGSGYDLALALAVDSQGRAHVAGMTESPDFPLKNALDSTLDPPWDAFIARLVPDGSGIDFSTLLGGSGTQQVLGIALDSMGDIYVAGYTDSADFPIVNAFQPDYGGGGGNGFVTRIKSDGSAIVYSTFLGGQDAIGELDSIAVNEKGEAYVAGSGGSDFPTVLSARPYSGAADAVFAKLTPDGSGVYYSSFYGGNGYDLASSIVLDSSGYLVIAGETASSNLATHWEAPQRAFGGATDAFVARFSGSVGDVPILSTPKLITVGTTYVGHPSPSKGLRIMNTGAKPLNFSSIIPSPNVSVSGNCSTVAPLASCNLNASLTLSSAAPGSGAITLYDDSPDSPQSIAVLGTGAFGGDLEVVTLTAGTPYVNYGALNVPFTAVVTNHGPYASGSVTLRVGNNIGGTECNPCVIGTLAAGASSTVRFNRVPNSFGMVPVTATVSSGTQTPDIDPANDSKTVVIPVPGYSASSTALDFASQPVHSSSNSQRIAFAALGSAAFRLSFTVTGDFAQTNNCGNANDNGCSVDVTFVPTASGARAGALVIYEALAGTTQTIPLAGTGTLAPFLSLSSSSVDLGTRMIGRASPTSSVILTNRGSANLQIVSISTGGDFSLTHNCPASLEESASCTIDVSFLPLGSGVRAGGINIQNNAVGNPHIVALTGTGATSPISLSPPGIDFGAQRVGIASSAQNVTLANVGGAAVRVSSLSAPAAFQQANNCGTLQPDATCAVSVTFSPTLMGPAGGTLVIHDDGYGSPRSVALTGTGVQPIVALDKSLLSFPSTKLNSSSPAQFIALTNNGNASLILSSVAVTGDFTLADGCGSLVPVRSTCYLVIASRPTAVGTRTGQLILSDDAPGSPHQVSLAGIGRALQLNVFPSSLTFAAQGVGTRSETQTVTIVNDSSSTLTLSSLATAGDFFQNNNCATQLAPDALCVVNVGFAPGVSGPRGGVLTLIDSAGNHGVSLSGTGASSAATISSASLNFSSVLVSGSASLGVTVTSTGDAPLNLATPSIRGIGFSFQSDCPTSLAVGRTCTVTVRFAPTAVGPFTGSLVLTDDAPGSPRTLSLSGSGMIVSLDVSRPGRPGRGNIGVPASKPAMARSSSADRAAKSKPQAAPDPKMPSPPVITFLPVPLPSSPPLLQDGGEEKSIQKENLKEKNLERAH